MSHKILKINKMNTHEIYVENIKCGGCVNSITKALNEIENVENLIIDKEEGLVTFNGTDETKTKIVEKLNSLGYPEIGHNDLLKKAKSYVSCAVGRMQ